MAKPLTKTQLVAAMADELGSDKKSAGAAIDAGVRIDVVPRPLCLWLARNDAFDRADLYTCTVTNTQVKNHMSHW